MATSASSRDGSAPDALSSYLRDIALHPLISPSVECELAARARAGDDDALDALVCANLRFVVAIAKRYRWHGVPLDDLISEGNLGLIRAARRFDETRGTRFITYAAWWIRQAITQAIADQTGTVRIPLERTRTMQLTDRHARQLTQQLGHEPTVAELAAAAGMTPEHLLALQTTPRDAVSLDGAAAHSPDARMRDNITNPDAEDAATTLMRRALAHDVARSVTTLSAREAHTLRLYFGLDGSDPMTLVEVGRSLGVSRERARQIKAKALQQLGAGDAGARLAGHRA